MQTTEMASNSTEGRDNIPLNVYDNPRIKALMESRDKAERALQEAILDIETREQDPAYKFAEELYSNGYRVEISEEYTDSDYIILKYTVPGNTDYKECTVVGISIDHTDQINFDNATLYENKLRQVSNVLEDLSINARNDKWKVLNYLLDLSSI